LMPSFLRILTSLTPAEKAEMISASVIRGILLRTWLNHWMNLRSVSPGRWCTA
jgi:hypothetical protein